LTDLQVVEIDESSLSRRHVAQQRALSDLARTEQQPHGKQPKRTRRSVQSTLNIPFNPWL
jgi:hypothetical protein